MKYRDLLVEKKKNIFWITLNRPQASNAFSLPMIHSLVSALKVAEEDDEVRVVILTGKGKNFCAGGDVQAMKLKRGMFAGKVHELKDQYNRGIQKIPLSFATCSKPIIAMMNGAAIGAGLDLALMCDIRLGTHQTVVGETFAKLGLVPAIGGSYFLQRVVGLPKALEMSLTARTYKAQEAYNMGLFHQVVGPKKLKEVTLKWAEEISSNAPVAVKLIKKAIYQAQNTELSSHLELLSTYQAILQRMEDHEEGINALLQKRTQNFSGR